MSVVEAGLAGAVDQEVLAHAVAEGRILLAADTDFGEILAASREPAPSVILLRRSSLRPEPLAAAVLATVDRIAAELEKGAFVVLGRERIRIRLLPLR